MRTFSVTMRLTKHARPHVIVNFAITADGKVSTRNNTPSQFTSPKDKQRLLDIRARGDAVMVGRNTLKTDNMGLGLSSKPLRDKRIAEGKSAFPIRVIVSASGRISPSSKVFEAPGGKIVIFSAKDQPKWATASSGIVWQTIHPFDLATCLRYLKKQLGIKTVVCEGGPTLFKHLAELRAIDELYLTVAPTLFGGSNAPTLTGLPGPFLSKQLHFSLSGFEVANNECYLHYKSKSASTR